jgi:hypothetical protein
MVYFRCKWSNNLIGVDFEYDVEQMRKHPDYDEVKEEVKQESDKSTKVKKSKED